jgi:ornithine carbamoyltransferase
MQRRPRPRPPVRRTLRETSDRDDAMNGAHVIYAKEWGSTSNYGNAEADARQRAALADWCVRDTWFSRAAVDCKLMHCLPVRRNVAVADEVLDSRRSVVQREAYNRLVVQTAVLHRCSLAATLTTDRKHP